LNVIEAIVGRIALIFALAGTPYLLARLLRPRLSLPETGALAGAISIAVNTAVPVLFHVCGIAITTASLTGFHTAIALVVVMVTCACKRNPRPPDVVDARPLLLMWVTFAVAVIPFTHLAGIDTYKWQGLATNVGVEGSIPWLIHPVSLLGFTPRAYPSAQPLVLATVQIMGRLGVDAGYYGVSLLAGITGIFAAYVLGRTYFDSRSHAIGFACFYVFSPVFMRYNHWATGRGFFLALYPLFILMLIKLPRISALVGAVLMSLLLALSHKVGLIAAATLVPLTFASFLMPRIQNRAFLVAIILPFVGLALLLSPPLMAPPPLGQLVGFLRASITRFGWMLPLAALGLLGVRTWLTDPRRRRLFPAMLATFPLAYPPDIYGAMMALPFLVLAATSGVTWITDRKPSAHHMVWGTMLMLTVAGASTIVGHRNSNATPKHVVEAARFLETYDPLGPFQVYAPGRARVQIHAYVSGCPRFLVTPSRNSQVSLRRPPALLGPPQEVAREWIDFGRNIVELNDLDVDWYGRNPRSYYVVIDGAGEKPDRSIEIYRADRVAILKPQLQELP
jgi:hypothetical protein